LDGVSVVDHAERVRVEREDGHQFAMYCDLKRLRKELISASPKDRDLLSEFVGGIRRCASVAPIQKKPNELMGPLERFGRGIRRLATTPIMNRWGRVSVSEFCHDLEDPFLREALPLGLGRPDLPMLYGMMVLAAMSRKAAGTPVGESHRIAEAIGRRFTSLGGSLHTRSQVSRILVEEGRAIGIRLADGREHRADHIVSACDGHTALFDWFEGIEIAEAARRPYAELCPVPPILLISIGIRQAIDEIPQTAAGFSFHIPEPVTIDKRKFTRLTIHVRGSASGLCPPGATLLNVAIDSSFERWKKLSADPAAYEAEKREVGEQVVSAVLQRFPDVEGAVDMLDVATPTTWHRITNNWRGSISGWMLTPKSLDVSVAKEIPGISGFHMIGHWTDPGGGLPAAALSARHIVQILCRKDRKRFHAAAHGSPG